MQRVFRVVDIADLKPMDVKPTDRMVRSVRDHGILVPVLLCEIVDENGVISLEILDGNRRVTAAAEVGLARVPAVVLQQVGPESASAMTVIANTLRSRNAVSEWQAVERLGDLGHDAEGIMRLTGLTKASLETRLRPSEMHPDLRRAMLEGRVSVTVWERAGRLPIEAQQRLADLLEERGGLRMVDVDAERKRAEAEETVRDDVELPPATEPPGTRAQLADRLAELAASARSIGLSEYEWSRLATLAWNRRKEPDGSPTGGAGSPPE
ncbi:MAG: ParB N-terminal domain-containing protein [Chloroflexota bacterium]|nr:ParB N-terminal domain-containing protein [Chloroflexota bacterium]